MNKILLVFLGCCIILLQIFTLYNIHSLSNKIDNVILTSTNSWPSCVWNSCETILNTESPFIVPDVDILNNPPEIPPM